MATSPQSLIHPCNSQSLASTHCRRDRDDGYRELAIRLDSVYYTLNQKHERNLGRRPGGFRRIHSLRNLAGTVRGLPRRSSWSRLVIGIGGIFVGLGWIGSGMAGSLHALYFWYALGGIGAGAVYGGCMGNSLKWFPDHRGMCAGFTAGAYGLGTALTVAPIAKMMKVSGYQHTFIFWGIIQGIIVFAAAMLIIAPPKNWMPKGWTQASAKVRTSAYDMTYWQMMKQSSFYVIYIMMTLVAFGGLVVTAQIKPIAVFYHVDKVIILWGMSALVVAIELDRILNGLCRPFWGWVSDHIGRENTMFIAFLLQGLAVLGLLKLISHPVWFILMTGLCFFGWGEIFSLFPSIVGDLYGRKWATTNYGIVYTAKGLAAIFAGPVAAMASVKTGSWMSIFWVMIACNVIAAFLALFWLKPVAIKTYQKAQEMFRLEQALAQDAANKKLDEKRVADVA